MRPVLTAACRFFRDKFARYVDGVPELAPEPSWPWLHVLDAWVYPLRYRTEWTPVEHELFFGATCLMTEFIVQCWEALGGEIKIEKNGEAFTIAIKTKAGLFPKWYTLPVHDSFRSILQQPQNPLPAMGQTSIVATDDTNFAAVFALGACAANSPFGKGEWPARGTGDMGQLDRVLPILADSTAGYYKRMFSGEPLGADRVLYLQQLLWPPTGFPGGTFGADAARSVAKHIGLLPSKSRDRIACLANLALLPVPTITESALVMLAALPGFEFGPAHLSRAYTLFMTASARYRDIIWDLRSSWGTERDYLQRKNKNAAEFERERRLSLLPAVVMPTEMALSDEYFDITKLLATSQLTPAAQKLDQKEGPVPADHHFQRAMIEKIMGNLVDGDRFFELAIENYGRAANAQCLQEWGLNALAQKDYTNAVRRLRRAYEIDSKDGVIACNFGWALFHAGERIAALRLLDQAMADPRVKLDALIKRAYIRFRENDADGCRKDLLEAAKIDPFDRRIVANLLAPAFEE